MYYAQHKQKKKNLTSNYQGDWEAMVVYKSNIWRRCIKLTQFN